MQGLSKFCAQQKQFLLGFCQLGECCDSSVKNTGYKMAELVLEVLGMVTLV